MKNYLKIIAIASLLFLIVGCKSQNYIKSEIEKANYCNTKDDCVNAGGKCPFGCYNFVNKNEALRIKSLVDSYKSNCVYQCISCHADCQNNKCIAACGGLGLEG